MSGRKSDLGTARYVSPQFFEVGKLYDTVLNRTASDAEVISWANTLVNPGDLMNVATAFVNSDEHRIAVVTMIYQEFLGRAPDPAGLHAWVAAMRAGMAAELVEASILSSDEYFQLHGGTDAGFVTSLYHDLFIRSPSAAEAGFWEATLAQGVSRFTVARGFISSSEYQAQLIRQFYADYLGRPVDDGGVKYWVGQLAAGVSLESVQIAILSSDEFTGIQRVHP